MRPELLLPIRSVHASRALPRAEPEVNSDVRQKGAVRRGLPPVPYPPMDAFYVPTSRALLLFCGNSAWVPPSFAFVSLETEAPHGEELPDECAEDLARGCISCHPAISITRPAASEPRATEDPPAVVGQWLALAARHAAAYVIPRGVHQVIVLFDDAALVIAPVHTELFEPGLIGAEDLQPVGDQAVPDVLNAGVHRVVGGFEI